MAAYYAYAADENTGITKKVSLPHIDVREYGAVGDGSTNDTTAIQNALDAAASGNGKTVLIPKGSYKVTGLSITGNVRVVGENQKNTFIKSTTDAAIITMTAGSGFRGGSLSGLTIQGNKSGLSQTGLTVTDGTYGFGFNIQNITIEECGAFGLFIGNAYSSVFKNIYLDDCIGYPFVYDAANMPANRCENVYVGYINTTTGFRIKAGQLYAHNFNGINNLVTNSIIAVVGRKSGVDDDVSNESATVYWSGCNFESYTLGAVKHYNDSVSFYKECTFAGHHYSLSGSIDSSTTSITLNNVFGLQTSGTIRIGTEDITYTNLSGSSLSGTVTRGANGTTAASHTDGDTIYNKNIKPLEYEVNTGSFPAFYRGGYLDDSCRFVDTPITGYNNNNAIHCNDIPPVQTIGKGAFVVNDVPIATYYNSTTTSTEMLRRADSYLRKQTITATTTITNPGVRYIELNHSSAITLTLPWAGWYTTQELLIIKDISGAAGTNTVTVNSGGGGTVNGSSLSINNNNQCVMLIPNTSGSGDWKVINNYTGAAGISGSLTNGRVTLSTGTSSVSDSSNFTFDNTNKILTVSGAGNNPHVLISDTSNTINLRLGTLAGAPDRAIVATMTNHPLVFYINGNEAWNIDTNKSLTPMVDNTSDIGASNLTIKDGYFSGSLIVKERTAPSTPSANTIALYAKDKAGTSALYFKNDAGTESEVGAGLSLPLADNQDILKNNSDNTKLLRFSLANISASTTRTLTVPDASFTLVGEDTTQTLTNKTIDGANNTIFVSFSDLSDSISNVTLAQSTFNTSFTHTTGLFALSWTGNTTTSSLFKLSSTNTSATGYILDVVADSTSSVMKPFRIQAKQNTVVDTDAFGNLSLSPRPNTSGTPNSFLYTGASHTGLSAGTEIVDVDFNLARTISRSAGAVSVDRAVRFRGRTVAFASSSTVTDAINVDIESVSAGSNATLTRSTALRIKPSVQTHHGLWVDGTVSYTGDAGAFGLSGVKIIRFVGSNGNMNSVFNDNGALSTSATDGFQYISRIDSSSSPSGTPTGYNGSSPIVLQNDSSGGNYRLWAYLNSGWRPLTAVQANSNFAITTTPTARTSGNPTYYSRFVTPADTGLTASTESVGIQFGGSISATSVTRQFTSGALTSQRENLFIHPTYAFTSASTLSFAATVAISSSPVAGTNATITNSYSLWVQGGSTRLDGKLILNKALVRSVVTLTDGATIATDASLGNIFKVTLAGNRTLGAPTNPTDGQQCIWEIVQDGTGSRTITLDTGTGGFAFGTDITAVTLTTTASKTDYMTAIYSSSANKWRVVAFVKGY